ncbi:hypothetical protein [Candidatus Nitrospira allomarina]|uniref:AMP-binding enzyme C-terminal domain-containing protein n=1 Tax=Candidatus Nitrospira allomarina TaxID=3020900 RepID=A0AA96GGE6_9BACT|nr:hypothetical protein [Candidatus Nitrospira allomarina]WNM57236.1 hypothetical protein PP769_14815 [Candidatus Nitrospira allomarina]
MPLKHMQISAGNRIRTAEIERALFSHEAVVEVVAIDNPQPSAGGQITTLALNKDSRKRRSHLKFAGSCLRGIRQDRRRRKI